MDENPPLLDAHEAPPVGLKELYKRYQKLKLEDLDFDLEVLDFNKARLGDDMEVLKPIPSQHLESILSRFVQEESNSSSITQDALVYGHERLPGKNLFSYCARVLQFPPSSYHIRILVGLVGDSLNLMRGRPPHTSSATANKCAKKTALTSAPSRFVRCQP
jgi:hypothetical protein